MRASSRPSRRPFVESRRGTFDATTVERVCQILREWFTGIGDEDSAASPPVSDRAEERRNGSPSDVQGATSDDAI